MGMTRSELIAELVAANEHLSKDDVRKVVDVVFARITDALAHGERVELRGFGVFDVKWQGPRERRNPRTGKQVAVLGGYKPFFKSGRSLREKLNQSLSDTETKGED
jgi:integration host factor subunit beta